MTRYIHPAALLPLGLLLLAICSACQPSGQVLTKQINQAQTDQTKALGALRADYPTEVPAGQPFTFAVWLEPSDPNFNGTVKVFTEQSGKVKYDPQEFELKPGARQKVIATIVEARSGLARIFCYAEKPETWTPIDETIDAGFSSNSSGS